MKVVMAMVMVLPGMALNLGGQSQQNAASMGQQNQNLDVGPGGRRRLGGGGGGGGKGGGKKKPKCARVVSGTVEIENLGQRCQFTQYARITPPAIVRYPSGTPEHKLPQTPSEANMLPKCWKKNKHKVCYVGDCGNKLGPFPFIFCGLARVKTQFGFLIRELNYKYVETDPSLSYRITSFEGDFRDIGEMQINEIRETANEEDDFLDVKGLPKAYWGYGRRNQCPKKKGGKKNKEKDDMDDRRLSEADTEEEDDFDDDVEDEEFDDDDPEENDLEDEDDVFANYTVEERTGFMSNMTDYFGLDVTPGDHHLFDSRGPLSRTKKRDNVRTAIRFWNCTRTPCADICDGTITE